MTGEPRRLEVAVPGEQPVPACLYAAAGGRPRSRLTLVLGHGAGAGQSSSFMVGFATALAHRGLDVLTFDFSYMARGRRVPDPPRRLEACFRAAIAAAHARGHRIAIGGKSLGGRIASQVAADSEHPLAAEPVGLVFLGYPLHPPGKPDRLRTAHLSRVRAPMLFLQGSRDTFGTPAELRPIVSSLAAVTTLHEVDGGDHSFKIPKRAAVAQADVHAAMQDVIAGWLADVGGGPGPRPAAGDPTRRAR